jgi:hypothetical protein
MVVKSSITNRRSKNARHVRCETEAALAAIVTVAEAVKQYEADLATRGAGADNAVATFQRAVGYSGGTLSECPAAGQKSQTTENQNSISVSH